MEVAFFPSSSSLMVAMAEAGGKGGDADYLVDVAVEMGWERENATSLSLSLSPPRRQTTTDVPPLGAACRRTEKGAFALWHIFAETKKRELNFLEKLFPN